MTFDAIIKGGSVMVAITGIGAGYYTLDRTYAREAKVAALDQRLQQKIVGDRYYELQRQLWALEDRYGKNCVQATPRVKEMCRAVLQQLQEAQEDLKQLRGK